MNSDMQEAWSVVAEWSKTYHLDWVGWYIFRPPGKKFTFRPTVGGKNQEAKQNSPPGFYHP